MDKLINLVDSNIVIVAHEFNLSIINNVWLYKNKIFSEAKMILETLGIFLENEDAKELFNKEGISHEGSRYFIPSDLVEKCLKTVPNEIKLYDREGNEHIRMPE